MVHALDAIAVPDHLVEILRDLACVRVRIGGGIKHTLDGLSGENGSLRDRNRGRPRPANGGRNANLVGLNEEPRDRLGLTGNIDGVRIQVLDLQQIGTKIDFLFLTLGHVERLDAIHVAHQVD